MQSTHFYLYDFTALIPSPLSSSSNNLELHLKPRIRPNALPVQPEQHRHRDEGQGHKSQQRIAPAQTKLVVHIQPGEGEHGAEDGAQNRVCGDGGRGVYVEGVDEVGLDGHHGREVADADECCADDLGFVRMFQAVEG